MESMAVSENPESEHDHVVRDAFAIVQGCAYQFVYENWRGDVRTYEVHVTRLLYGTNQWHPDPCWLLEGTSRGEYRTFDLRKIQTSSLRKIR